MKKAAGFGSILLALVFSAETTRGDTIVLNGSPQGTRYRLFDMFGGTWQDAEKSSDNTEDDMMCWAAQASNLLAWTGFGDVAGMTTTDQMFQYFQDHWTDKSGNSWYGLDWWFDGTNDGPGGSTWSQVDVPGGGFFLDKDIADYRHWSADKEAAMETVDSYITAGWATGLSILADGGLHAITCWGFNVNPDDPTDYYGIWITDSDDDKDGPGERPDALCYYEVSLHDDAWYLQGYDGGDDWCIREVIGMESVPEPISLYVLLLGGTTLLRRRR